MNHFCHLIDEKKSCAIVEHCSGTLLGPSRCDHLSYFLFTLSALFPWCIQAVCMLFLSSLWASRHMIINNSYQVQFSDQNKTHCTVQTNDKKYISTISANRTLNIVVYHYHLANNNHAHTHAHTHTHTHTHRRVKTLLRGFRELVCIHLGREMTLLLFVVYVTNISISFDYLFFQMNLFLQHCG